MQWYDRCLSSIRKQSCPVNTIIVDNASCDGTVDYIRSHYPEVILIESKENLGFGKGNNIGIRYALNHGCSYFFLINQDTWFVSNNTVENLIRIAEENRGYGIISPMHYKADMQSIGMLWENGNNLCSKQLISDILCGKLKEIYETNYVNAAAWLLPRKTILDIGGFDPIYKHYEEDDDYINRVLYHGLKIGICPSERIVHDHRTNLSNPFKTYDRYHHEQELLVKMTNPNTSFSSWKYSRYFVRKIISAALNCDWKCVSSYYKDIVFVHKKRSAVLESRKQNMKSCASWL